MKSTYTIVIINIRTDLILLVFLGGILGGDLSVRRNEPISRGLAFTIMMGDFPFEGSYFGELINCRLLAAGSSFTINKEAQRTVTKDMRSASCRCATTFCKHDNNNAPRNNMVKEWLGRISSLDVAEEEVRRKGGREEESDDARHQARRRQSWGAGVFGLSGEGLSYGEKGLDETPDFRRWNPTIQAWHCFGGTKRKKLFSGTSYLIAPRIAYS